MLYGCPLLFIEGHESMPLFASNFGGPYGIYLGCAALLLFILFTFGWIWLQLKSLLSADRLSWVSLALNRALLHIARFPGGHFVTRFVNRQRVWQVPVL